MDINTSQYLCNELRSACNAAWQRQIKLEAQIVKSSAEFIDAQQMVAKINQMQQDMIMLDVGGHDYHLSKRSVTRHRDSFFGGMFSDAFYVGNCAEPHFIDRDGEMFDVIASYLRYGSHPEWIIPRKGLKNECMFYCLPSPAGLFWMVLLEKSDDTVQSIVHFISAHGEHIKPLSLPPVCNEYDWSDVASNLTSLFMAKKDCILKYHYATDQWTNYELRNYAPWDTRELFATTNALFALTRGNALYAVHFNDDVWQWTLQRVGIEGVSTSNDVLHAFTSRTILAYTIHTDQTRSWSQLCLRPAGELHWFFVTPSHVYAQIDDAVMLLNMKDGIWIGTNPSVYVPFATRACKLGNTLHLSGYAWHNVHYKCEIAECGSLSQLTSANWYDYAPSTILGICEAFEQA